MSFNSFFFSLSLRVKQTLTLRIIHAISIHLVWILYRFSDIGLLDYSMFEFSQQQQHFLAYLEWKIYS